MFDNIGPMELLMVLVIVLVLFGAKRVPEIGASIGKGIREFKRGLNELHETSGADAGDEPVQHVASIEAPETERTEPRRLLNP